MKTEGKNITTVTVNLNHIDAVKDFCNIASNYAFEIDTISGKYVINGKSILGLFSLDLSKDIRVEISSEDEEAANVEKFLSEIKKYIVK